LTIELLPESRARVRALAIHSEIRADHVTLKHGFDRPFDAAWIPAGRNVGDVVGMRATGIADDGRVQALVVEILGSSRRPSDG
ncbi:hypothetical protein ACE4ZV_26840, partial [Salmonella enterica]|uniref:hypothetical protein n=1 Tax=Salmonella enterica TaxID=28901 RepID=UPI003D2A1DE8